MKLLFIKDDKPSNVNPTRWNMKTLVSKMVLAIANEDTRLRPKSQFGGVIQTKERPTLTTKFFQKFVIRCEFEQIFKGGFMLGDFEWELINEIDCSLKSRVPKSERNIGSSKKGQACFNNVAMFSFNRPYLMMRMWTTETIGHSHGNEGGLKRAKFNPIVNLNKNDFGTKIGFNKLLETTKCSTNIKS